MIAATLHRDETTVKLSEGLTLLLSAGLLYLLFTSGSWWTSGLSIYLIGPTIGLFTIVSLLHAFTRTRLTDTYRMMLSIWSTIILVILALVNISLLRSMDEADLAINMEEKFTVLLQYFLLGVSAIYLMQNVLMLIEFLPGRGTFFNAEYFKNCTALRKQHIERYSDQQVHPVQSLFAVAFCLCVFGVNYYYNFVPPVTAVWFTLMVFPVLLRGFLAVKYINKPQLRK